MTNEVRTDHVIVATSFEVDIDRLDYLEPTLLASFARETGGIPPLSTKFESFISQLFMLGVASSPVFGPTTLFMYSAKYVAPAVDRWLDMPA